MKDDNLREQLDELFMQNSIKISQLVSDGKLSDKNGRKLFNEFRTQYMAQKELLEKIEALDE